MIKINSNYFITIKILNINSIRILNTGLGFLSQQIQGIQKKKNKTLGNFFLERVCLRCCVCVLFKTQIQRRLVKKKRKFLFMGPTKLCVWNAWKSKAGPTCFSRLHHAASLQQCEWILIHSHCSLKYFF